MRSLALNNDGFVHGVLGMRLDTVESSRLEPKAHAFVRLAALAATGASPSCYHEHVQAALAAGASFDEIVGILVAIAPAIGLARVVSAASDLGSALGYDVRVEREPEE